MNVYTGLLFLHGHFTDASLFEDDTTYAKSSYGNRVANERALREAWGREDDVDATEGRDADQAKAA